ncbi:hypothetical protein ACHAWF_011662 [Thalassiosira exigua]
MALGTGSMLGVRELAAEELSRPDADVGELLRRPGVDANFLLFEASRRDRVGRMEEPVRKWNADVNAAVDVEGHMVSPLFGAVKGSAVSAVEWLLSEGADSDGRCVFEDGACVTPLWTAAENGHARIGKLLLDHGADVNAAKSNTPLYIATQNHHPAMLSLLLSFGADPNKFLQPKTSSLSPLELAIGCGHPRLVAQLIHSGALISMEAPLILTQVQYSKKSIDQRRWCISDKELGQIKELLVVKPYLRGNSTYNDAKAAERAGEYQRALKLLRALEAKCPCTQLTFDIDRMVEAIYGVRGSDCTISIWDDVPLMSQVEPTLYVDYAWTQLGRKIYRHGGIDRSENVLQREELWELDIDTRTWTLRNTGGQSPGSRLGHTMWSYRNALFVWGGRTQFQGLETKLYRLPIGKDGPLTWEVVKTSMKPPGREYHAGVLYKGKYYMTCGNAGIDCWAIMKDTWVLNMSNFRWYALKDSPVDRYSHGIWAADDKLFILGGRKMHMHLLESNNSQAASYSIENFVSFDLKSKSWTEESIVGDRPFEISEFTVLPLYGGASTDGDSTNLEPSSIIIWGGYSEHDGVNGPRNEHEMEAHYGEDCRDFQYLYPQNLYRFYPRTMVWKKLRSMTKLFPKAQSYAAEIKTDSRSVHLLIGGGYGFTAESVVAEPEIRQGQNWRTPKSSNQVYSVITGNLGDSFAALDMLEGTSRGH